MTTTGLQGPYKLDEATIDAKVTKTSAGAYALGHLGKEGGFVPKYVGRADDDVNKRLKDWIDEHTHFQFEYYGSPKAAFEKECDLYHDWKKQLDNKVHPARPKDSKWQCPRCDNFKP